MSRKKLWHRPAAAQRIATLFCLATCDIPELDVLRGDKFLVTDLGQLGGATLQREIDPARMQAILSHGSVSVSALPPARRGQSPPTAPGPLALLP